MPGKPKVRKQSRRRRHKLRTGDTSSKMRPASERSRSKNRHQSSKRSKSKNQSKSRNHSRSRSLSPTKRSRNSTDFLFEMGTLGSGLGGLTLSQTAINDNYSGDYNTTMSQHDPQRFVKLVRNTFSDKPAVYKTFVQIMAQVQHAGTDKLDLIKRVITLFDGYPLLIVGFNAFLPSDYTIQIQGDAVIIKVFESFGSNTEHIDTGHFRNYALGNKTEENYPNDTLSYVHKVKDMYADRPKKYHQFCALLKDYHSEKVNAVETVHKIVKLFRDYPHLVSGFNAFLPQGFHIHMYKKGYDIEYPGDNPGEVTIAKFKM